MKFLGQYIQSFIARFRNDVYLEDVASGTIASGGNLGLDSNNKIVKADVPADGDITSIAISDTSSSLTIASGDGTFQFLGGEGIDASLSTLSSNFYRLTIDGEDASDSNKGIVELATTAEATTGTDTSRAVTAAGVAAVHATAQTGKNYRIINTSFRQDIGTTKYYLPFKSQDENVTVHREEVSELAVCDGRVVSVTLRVENLNTHSGDANVTFGVTTNVVGATYATFTEQETEALAINDGDDHHLFHYVFDNAKHWDSTDMFAISIQSDTDISGSNERFYITVVIEDDWNTYLAGSSREIDSTP